VNNKFLIFTTLFHIEYMQFKEGFIHKGFKFGWHNKKLYRLPLVRKGKRYSLRKLDIIPIGNKEGFRLIRDKKSIDQVRDMTSPFKSVVKIVKCRECL